MLTAIYTGNVPNDVMVVLIPLNLIAEFVVVVEVVSRNVYTVRTQIMTLPAMSFQILEIRNVSTIIGTEICVMVDTTLRNSLLQKCAVLVAVEPLGNHHLVVLKCAIIQILTSTEEKEDTSLKKVAPLKKITATTMQNGLI